MYICADIELMMVSISLVDVTMMDLWKNKNMTVVVMMMMMITTISNRNFN
jgi:hypothetical protein